MALELKVEGQLNVDNGTKQALETYSDGDVTWPNRAAFQGYNYGETVAGDGNWHVINLNTANIDTQSGFTAPYYEIERAGNYWVYGRAYCAGMCGTQILAVRVRKGASTVLCEGRENTGAATDAIANAGILVALSAGDKIYLDALHTCGGGVNKTIYGYLTVIKVN